MTARKIAAKAGTDDNAPSAEVEFDFGDNIEEAIEKFGDDVVFSRFLAASTVDIQALMRRMLTPKEDKEGKVIKEAASQEEIQAAVAEYKPGVSARKRLTAKEKASRALAELSEEDRNQLLEALMGGGE